MEKNFNHGDWVICGYLEDYWEKYPAPDGLRNRPEQVDFIRENWVHLKSGSYLDIGLVRPATEQEFLDWMDYLEG